MKLSSINEWLTLMGSVGVIAGIIFLGVELQQNNLLLQAQARLAQHDMRSDDANRVFFKDVDLAQIFVKARNDEDLSQKEVFVLERYLRQVFLDWQFEFVEFSQGSISTEEFTGPIWANTMLALPRAMELWARIKNASAYRAEFVQFIDDSIADE